MSKSYLARETGLDAMLGRYELVDADHSKFWTIEQMPDGMYRASWGKIGREPQAYKEYGEFETIAKIREKIGKGYSKVGGKKVSPKKEKKESNMDDKEESPIKIEIVSS